MNQVAARRTDKHFMYQKFKMQDLASPLIDSLLPSRPRDPRDTSQDRQDVEYISSCALTRRLKMRIQWLLLAPPSQDIDTEFLKPLKNDGLDVFILIDCDTRWVAGWTLLSESSSYASPFFTFSQFQAIQRTTTRARVSRRNTLLAILRDYYSRCEAEDHFAHFIHPLLLRSAHFISFIQP